MFYDIKDQMDSLNVLQIMAYSEYESSIERAKQKAAEFHRHESWQLYGWIENGEIVGVCGFEVHKDYVEILNIAVAESVRHHGVGGKMITALWKKYEMTIEAETDDDAVDFYRKRGFQATAIQKYGISRWTCVLAAPKPLDQVTDEERARLFPVILSDYNPAWPQWFTEEKENLLRLIGVNNIARIRHYESTSIPGLLAKPTVDILLEIIQDTDIDKLITSLPYPEYICLNPPTTPSEPPHLMFLKGYTPTGFADKVYHTHVRYPSDWDELHFRDYLIAYPETAAEYATLKAKLYKDFEYNRDGYTDAKRAFIRAVTEKAWKETALERMMENNHWVEEILKDRNLALIGFADLSEIDVEIRYGYQYGICIAIALKVFPSATNEPSKEYYDEYKNVSARLREASDFLAEKIKERGFNAYSLAHERQNEAYRTQLPFKTLATRAGLGWIGKSAALITKEYGNAIRLNGVLTDLPIKVGTPVNESFCGECDKCVKHCPGHAITGNTWRLHIDRDILLDAVSCKKQSLKEEKYLT
jgi:GrpB-like predicted nucleotidyltransferase (UPF0157 family)/N-acetylglutamate synthase-like GNAT family acetyltransferase/ferredoxin